MTICRHYVIIKVFWCWRVSLVKFSCWSKFHVNFITGSRVMTFFLYKWLTRNPEIRNTLAWVLLNIADWGKLDISNLARMSLLKCYWMLQNAKVTAFSISDLLRKKQQGVKLPFDPSTRLWFIALLFLWFVRQKAKVIDRFSLIKVFVFSIKFYF